MNNSFGIKLLSSMTSKYNNIKCKPQFVTVMQNRWKGQLVLESYYLDLFFPSQSIWMSFKKNNRSFIIFYALKSNKCPNCCRYCAAAPNEQIMSITLQITYAALSQVFLWKKVFPFSICNPNYITDHLQEYVQTLWERFVLRYASNCILSVLWVPSLIQSV